MKGSIEILSPTPIILTNWYRVDILIDDKWFDRVFFDTYEEAQGYILSHIGGSK